MDERTLARGGLPAGSTESFVIPLAARAGIRVEGSNLVAEPMAEWIRTVVQPLRVLPALPEEAPEIAIRFTSGVRPSGSKKSSIPGGFAPEGVWVADHLGRAAVLPLANLDGGGAEVDPRIDPSFFISWVYMPLARTALWRTEATLVHAAAVELDGRRIVFTGWSGTGKTFLLLEMLKGGANLLADDWLVLAADGTVGQVTGHLEIMQFHWNRIFEAKWPGKSEWKQRTGRRMVSWGSRRTQRMPFLSRGLARLEESWHPDTLHTSLESVFPSARQALPGPIDTLVILDPERPSSEVTNDQAAEMLASQGSTFLLGHAALEGASRFAHPGAMSRSLFPSFQEERDLAARGLAGARVTTMAFDPSRDDPRRAIEAIVKGSERRPIGAADDANN